MLLLEPIIRERVTFRVDQPAWVQLLRYIGAVAQLDFGFSYRQNMPVLERSGGRARSSA